MLGQGELSHLLFPLGDYTKEDVRRIAANEGLHVAEKADSVEVCFVANGDYRPFVEARFPQWPGEIVDTGGRMLGQHQGLARHTIGQRHGLGLGGGRRLYVIDMDVPANRLVVGSENELYSFRLVASAVNWVFVEAPHKALDTTARIRYRSAEAAAKVFPKKDSVEVHFHKPQRAVTPGQAVVFYLGEEVLGGGIVERVDRDAEGCSTYVGGRATASEARL